MCGEFIDRKQVLAGDADRWREKISQAICSRPKCLWSSLSETDKLNRVLRAGVGRQYIRNSRGEVAAPGDEVVLPGLESFARVSGYDMRVLQVRPERSSFICGPVNTGKSWLMCALAVEALAGGHQVEVINWSRFKRRVRSSYQPAATVTEQEIFEQYRRAGVLCVDDLGVGLDAEGRETKAAVEMLYDLIDQRYWSGKITHISSNLNPQNLAEHYDRRIARRILERCQVVVLDRAIRAGEPNRVGEAVL